MKVSREIMHRVAAAIATGKGEERHGERQIVLRSDLTQVSAEIAANFVCIVSFCNK